MCLTFWYHMLGADVNALSVYFTSTSVIGLPYWQRLGSQSRWWQPARVRRFVNDDRDTDKKIRSKIFLNDIIAQKLDAPLTCKFSYL